MRQVEEWLIFYRREPWGYEAFDMRNALLALVVARSAGAKDTKLDQFRLRMPDPTPEKGNANALADKVRAFFHPKVLRPRDGET